MEIILNTCNNSFIPNIQDTFQYFFANRQKLTKTLATSLLLLLLLFLWWIKEENITFIFENF